MLTGKTWRGRAELMEQGDTWMASTSCAYSSSGKFSCAEMPQYLPRAAGTAPPARCITPRRRKAESLPGGGALPGGRSVYAPTAASSEARGGRYSQSNGTSSNAKKGKRQQREEGRRDPRGGGTLDGGAVKRMRRLQLTGVAAQVHLQQRPAAAGG